MTRWARLAPVVGAALVLTLAAPAAGIETVPAPDAAEDGAAAGDAAPTAQEPLLVTGRVRLEPAGDVTIALGGVRYFGVVEFRPDGQRLRPIVETELETYLLGIAEMPARWHLEALRAQAIAARTYVLHVMATTDYDGFDICATTACQVFRGAEVVLAGPVGERWREAVTSTAGQVLVDDAGEPILARYFSTSGGRTFANEEAFPSSGPRPYLVSIDDPDDRTSPYHRWTVRFTREEFDALAARGDNLRRVSPVAAAVRLGDVEDPRALIRFTGENGRRVEVPAIALRDFLSTYAPRAYPDRFPGPRDDGLGPLPTTVPSTRYAIEVTEDAVVLSGRGWGHGVGLGQYGALGRAERGEDHRAILAAYYGGLVPVPFDDAPSTVRVGLDRFSGDRSVRFDGVTAIRGGDDVLVPATLGTWTVEPVDGGMRLVPPVGEGAPLAVAPTTVIAGADRLPGRFVEVAIDVNKPVLLRLEVTDADGALLVTEDLGLAEAGTHRARWWREDAAGVAVAPGEYRVALVGQDAEGVVEGTPVTVTVTEPPAPPEPPAAPGPAPGVPVRVLVLGLALLALAALVVGSAWRRSGAAGAVDEDGGS